MIILRHAPRSQRRLVCLLLLLLPLLAGAARRNATPETRREQAPPPVQAYSPGQLLAASTGDSLAGALDADRLLITRQQARRQDPLFAAGSFLLAEIHRLRGESDRGVALYRDLVLHAAGDSTAPGSALAAPALWRWLCLLDEPNAANSPEVTTLLAHADSVIVSPLSRGLFKTEVLTDLPLLEEDLLRRLALLAWSAGDEVSARRHYLAYQELARDPVTPSTERAIRANLMARGELGGEALRLTRARRLLDLAEYDTCERLLASARRSEDPDLRAEAILLEARLEQRRSASRREIIALLGEAAKAAEDSVLKQKALYRRAMWQKDKELRAELERLVRDYPQGPYADDALYQLGRSHQFRGEWQEALAYYARLVDGLGENEYRDAAAFHAAIVLIGEGEGARADALLALLTPPAAGSSLRLGALFWRGRLAEDSGRRQEAERLFAELVEAGPYGYYGLRARFHLRYGNEAVGRVWPDSLDLAEVAGDAGPPQERTSDQALALAAGVEAAVAAGLYDEALQTEHTLRRAYPSRRIETLALAELERSGQLPGLLVLLSLRQESRVAAWGEAAAPQRIALADRVGHGAGDWAQATRLTLASHRPVAERAVFQREAGYLAAAYPAVYRDLLAAAAARRAVPPELLYAVARRESLFHSEALSRSDALGLFQFTPWTFEALDKRWSLRAKSGIESRDLYLLDPERSIELGARWFAEELLARQKGDIPLAVMEHNAGFPSVRRWKRYWAKLERSHDLEYMVETIPYGETRVFLRGVLTDLALVAATGRFAGDGTPQRPAQMSGSGGS